MQTLYDRRRVHVVPPAQPARQVRVQLRQVDPGRAMHPG